MLIMTRSCYITIAPYVWSCYIIIAPYVWSCFTTELSLVPLFSSCLTMEKNNATHALGLEQDRVIILILAMEKYQEQSNLIG